MFLRQQIKAQVESQFCRVTYMFKFPPFGPLNFHPFTFKREREFALMVACIFPQQSKRNRGLNWYNGRQNLVSPFAQSLLSLRIPPRSFLLLVYLFDMYSVAGGSVVWDQRNVLYISSVLHVIRIYSPPVQNRGHSRTVITRQ